MADAQHGISGAACRLPEMNAIIVNRNEPLSRRSFDLAHEIFHILTWEAMPPDYLDGTNVAKSRIEQLADKFASGLLLPTFVLDKYLDVLNIDSDDFIKRVNEVATELMVSSQALLWRLVDMGRLNSGTCRDLTATDSFTFNGGLLKDETPPLLSRKFLDLMSAALTTGRISERRVSGLLDMSLVDLGNLFEQYEIENPLGL